MIAFTGTVGTGMFFNTGVAFRIAGPIGVILAFFVVGLVATAAQDGVSEMISHWPIENAKVVFVQEFVDKELGVVTGIAYL